MFPTTSRATRHRRVVSETKYAWARIAEGSLVVTHYFNPRHDRSPWGWEENLILDIVCSPLPDDVLKQFQELIDKFMQR